MQNGLTHLESLVGADGNGQLGVVTALELLAHGLESFDRLLDILERMSRRGNDAQDDLALRDDGIDHDRAEDTVVLAQVDHQVGSLRHTALEEDGGHGRIGDADVETVLLEAALQSADDLPQLLLIWSVG